MSLRTAEKDAWTPEFLHGQKLIDAALHGDDTSFPEFWLFYKPFLADHATDKAVQFRLRYVEREDFVSMCVDDVSRSVWNQIKDAKKPNDARRIRGYFVSCVHGYAVDWLRANKAKGVVFDSIDVLLGIGQDGEDKPTSGTIDGELYLAILDCIKEALADELADLQIFEGFIENRLSPAELIEISSENADHVYYCIEKKFPRIAENCYEKLKSDYEK